MTSTEVKPFAIKNEKKEWFVKFCNETSLHGWPYFNYEMGKFWKLIWFLFLLAICILSVFVIVMNIQQYVESTTVTTIESTMAPLKDVTFPSIYICNINQVILLFSLILL